MANTPNFDLYKPHRADTNVEVDTSLSDNFTKIDTELKVNKDGLAGHISNPNAHTSENVSHADGSVKTTLDNHDERLGGLETDTEGLEVRVNDIETLGLDKLAPNLEGRIQTIESDVEGFLAPATFDAMDQQSYTFDEYRIGYVDNKLTDIMVNVKSKGAKGDGVTDDTLAIQTIIDGMTTGGTIFFPKGTYKITNLSILNPYITLKGEGTIYNGNITIGKNIINEPYREYFTVIEGLRFDRDSLSNTVDAVEMQRAQRVRVTNCKFNNYNSCLAVKQVDLFDPPEPQGPNQAHVMRAQIDNCMIMKTNHVLRVYKLLSAGIMSSGDIQVFDNTAYCLKRHIYAEGLDGLICSGNTFLFPDNLNTAENANKLENIYVDKGAEIIISDNNLFEAGADSVLLSGVQFFTITGNNIAFPAQRIKGDGIRIINGDPSGEEYSVGTIVGNHVIFPTKGGIGIENNSSHISIVGNTIRDAGNTSRYYGTVQTVTPYGIKIASTAKYVSEFGNVCTGGTTPIINDSQFGFSTVKEQNGKTGNLSLTTTFGSIGTITFPKAFDKIPNVQIMLDGIGSQGTVTIVPTNITATGFTISGFGSIANTITVSWRALI